MNRVSFYSLSDQTSEGASGRKWLAVMLAERFGIPVDVRVDSGGLLRLHLEDSEKSIVFDTPVQDFYDSQATLAYTCWDASSEGWLAPCGDTVPAPGFTALKSPLIEDAIDGDDVLFHYDVPGVIYWALNRVEELQSTELDVHQRFPVSASHAYHHGYLERPFIDEWLYVLRQLVQRLLPNKRLKSPQFSIQVSHDVDSFSRYRFRSAQGFIKNLVEDVVVGRDLSAALMGARIRYSKSADLLKRDPYNTFDWLMDVAESCGIRSAFYFICGTTDRLRDADYSLDAPELSALLLQIYQRGHEIGLHPSFGACDNPRVIEEEARSLGALCQRLQIRQQFIGGRMHYLRWKHPTTLLALEAAGLSYDGTMGYPEMPGFRCGTCFEYPAYDCLYHKILGIRIRPLVAMDTSVITKRYLGLGAGSEALKTFITFKDRCKKVGGNFSLLWHNSSLVTPEQRQLYRAILQHSIAQD